MAWVAIIALAAWVFHLARQVDSLKRRLGPDSKNATSFAPAAPLWPALVVEDRRASEAVAAVDPSPLVTTSPAPARVESVATASAPAEPIESSRPTPPRIRPPAMVAGGGRSASGWLAEDGLAWVGGGALALGGLLLVAYAAERGVFTPAWRIGAAILAGFAMLAAGEVVRRGWRVGRNPLVAALASGAGAATLYAAIWAAQALYGYIPFGAAAVLLALVSLGLLGLAALHGEALALLAIAAAFAVPLVSGPDHWRAGVLDAYLALLCVTGFGAAIARDWPRTALATLAAATLWAAAELVADDAWRGPLVLLLLPLVPALAAFEIEERRVTGAARPWTQGHALVFFVAVLVTGMLLPGLWKSMAVEDVAAGAVAACTLCVATAAGLRRMRLPGWLMIVPAAAACMGFMFAQTSAQTGSEPSATVWAGLAVAVVLAGSVLAVALAGRRDLSIAAAGAVGAAALVALAAAALPAWAHPYRWAVLATGAAALLAGAASLARTSPQPDRDAGVGLWIGASAALVLYAVEAAMPGSALPAAYAAVALGYAALALRPGWRGLVEAAGAATLAGLAALFAPGFAAAALTGRLGLGELVVVAAAGVGLLLAGSRLLRRREAAATAAEAMSTAALLAGLTGAFLSLRVLGQAHGAHATLDPFSEAALRTLLLLAAGVLPTGSQPPSVLSLWRSGLLLLAGVLHGLAFEGGALNPWWGDGGPVTGPPIIDALALGLLAPALLLAAAAWRSARSMIAGTIGRVDLVVTVSLGLSGLAFALLWLVLEIRRLFHGAVLPGPFAVDECAAYGLAALGVAWALQRWDERRPSRADEQGPGASAYAAQSAGWAGPGVAVAMFAYVASPWWGPLAAPLRGPWQAAGLVALYAAGVAVAGVLGRGWRARERPVLARVAATTAVVVGFALLTLAIRLGYRGLDLRASLREAGAETWTYSAAWACYGVAVLGLGARMRSPSLRWAGLAVLLATTVKVFLFDLSRLDGVVRAGSFLALGALLLLAALLARRWGGAVEAPSALSSR